MNTKITVTTATKTSIATATNIETFISRVTEAETGLVEGGQTMKHTADADMSKSRYEVVQQQKRQDISDRKLIEVFVNVGSDTNQQAECRP